MPGTDRSVIELTNVLKEIAKHITHQNQILASIDKHLADLAPLAKTSTEKETLDGQA